MYSIAYFYVKKIKGNATCLVQGNIYYDYLSFTIEKIYHILQNFHLVIILLLVTCFTYKYIKCLLYIYLKRFHYEITLLLAAYILNIWLSLWLKTLAYYVVKHMKYIKAKYNMFLLLFTKVHVRGIYIMFSIETILMLLIGFSKAIK